MSKKVNPGAWLKKQRAERNLTQEQLAEETGLTVRDIRRIEENDLTIGSSKLVVLADHFDTTVEEILYGEADGE